ncbi:hypothetical protein HK100_004881 [Physocladia obscura]|uniref:AAA+ ATPase domain-containing protein n=1 Tax=Physocladia obscura TaxID=109957 RepID=A0AAD5X8G9_9FUNG|nr:hypothetical protein HK100_004881 [Physocladia obscura]
MIRRAVALSETTTITARCSYRHGRIAVSALAFAMAGNAIPMRRRLTYIAASASAKQESETGTEEDGNSTEKLYFDSANTNSNVNHATLRRIAATTLLGLVTPTTNANSDPLLPSPSSRLASLSKPGVALVAPHPGATALLEAAVASVAKNANADLLKIDFLSVLQLAASSSPTTLQYANLTQPSQFVPAKPFSPSAYALAKDVSNTSFSATAYYDNEDNDIGDDFDPDLDDEDDDEKSSSANRRNAVNLFSNLVSKAGNSPKPATVHHHHHHHQTFPVTVKVVVDGKEVAREFSNTSGGRNGLSEKAAADAIINTVFDYESSANVKKSVHNNNGVQQQQSEPAKLESNMKIINSEISAPSTLHGTPIGSGRPGRLRISVEHPLKHPRPSTASNGRTTPTTTAATTEKSSTPLSDFWDPSSQAMRKNPEMSHYEVTLKSAHIDRVIEHLLSTILNQQDTQQKQRRVIIWYQDTTDTLQSAGDTGKRVISALVNLVNKLRTRHGIGAVLIAGCTPGLMDLVPKLNGFAPAAENGSQDAAKARFAVFDDEKFARMIDGSEMVVPKQSASTSSRQTINEEDEEDENNEIDDADEDVTYNLATSGKMYDSVLDKVLHMFEKVEVPPPIIVASVTAPVATAATIAVSSPNNKPLASTTISTATVAKQISKKYLHNVREALAARHREMNSRLISLHAQSRGLRVVPPTLSTDALKYPTAYAMLGHSVWSLDRVRRVVAIAVGLQMIENGSNGAGSVVEVGASVFEEALQVLKEETWGGLVEEAMVEGEKRRAVVAAAAAAENDGGGVDGDGGLANNTSTTAASGGGGSGSGRDDKGGSAVGNVLVPTVSNTSSTSAPQSQPQQQQQHTVMPAFMPHSADAAVESTESTTSNLKRELKRQGHKLNSYESKMLSTVVTPASIAVSFSDLILPPPTKLMLQTLVSLPLLRPDLFQSGILAKHSISGVLLFGPPGTGKTLLAKAAAKSSGANFMSVSLSDIFDKYVGEGEKNVRAIFTLARKLSPCVVFLDEVDALFGARRGGDGITSSKREIINEFMSEWDGLNSRNRGVIVLGATNRPFDLDDAVLRRMPRRVLIDLPNELQRKEILRVHLQDEFLASDVSLTDLAVRTKLYSGSDLKNVCISAALASVKESLLRESLKHDTSLAIVPPPVKLTSFTSLAGPTLESNQTDSSKKFATSLAEPSVASTIEPIPLSPPNPPLVIESSAEILKRLEGLDDWRSVLQPQQYSGEKNAEKRVVSLVHFDVALKEVPPSLTDEMQTLIELRKWDESYGDGGAKGKAKVKKEWGF